MKLQDIRFGTKALTIFLALMPFSGAYASVGNADGGGGKGVVCRNSNGSIKSVELLDLWEAKTIYHLKPQALKNSVNESVLSNLKKLSESLVSDGMVVGDVINGDKTGSEAVNKIFFYDALPFLNPGKSIEHGATITWISGKHLSLSEDSFEPVQPGANCKVEQLVRYQDFDDFTGNILINQDLWKRLDPLNQAALITHEVYYKFLRESSFEKNSLRVRRAIGKSFSGQAFSALNQKNLSSDYYSCEGKPNPYEGVPEAVGVSKIFIVHAKDKNNQSYAVIQAAMINGIYILDNKPVTVYEESVLAPSVNDFSDLSSLINDSRYPEIYSQSSLQPELHAQVAVEQAGADGHLKILLGVPASNYFPQGIAWRSMTCEYHGAK